MSDIKDVKKHLKKIAEQLEVNEDNLKAAIELVTKNKIAKPAKIFRDSMSSFKETERYEFLYLELSQRSYFLMNDVFPFGDELDDEIEDTKKEIEDEDKEDKLEILNAKLFLLEELDELDTKGFAIGTIKFSKTVNQADASGKMVTEHRMALRMNDLEVNGTIKKPDLADVMRKDLKYKPITKTNELIYLEGENANEDDTDKEITEKQKKKREKRQNREKLDEVTALAERNKKIEKKLIRLKDRFKNVKSASDAYKGLGLLYQMDKLSEYVKPFPEDTVENPLSEDMKQVIAVLNNLEANQQKLEGVVSSQIDAVFEDAVNELNNTATINSSEQLEDIFGTTIKMHDGWRKFLDKKDSDKHKYGDRIVKIDEEIDIIDKYEDQLVPLQEQYKNEQRTTRKNELGSQINELVEAARIETS